jgi:hypothetical protein
MQRISACGVARPRTTPPFFAQLVQQSLVDLLNLAL